MPTGSYEGVVGGGIGLDRSVCGEGERDIFCGRPCDSLQVANSYSGVLQRGTLAPWSTAVASRLPFLLRDFQEPEFKRV